MGAEAVRAAITRTIITLPEQVRRSLIWDQGAEMAQHVDLRIATGLQIYFCDPHSPWQRGTNENTNGLLRQYFPKGTDLSAHRADDLAAVAMALNSRPRKALGWKTPAEALDQYLRAAKKLCCDDRLNPGYGRRAGATCLHSRDICLWSLTAKSRAIRKGTSTYPQNNKPKLTTRQRVSLRSRSQ
jgi:hypothetical protein